MWNKRFQISDRLWTANSNGFIWTSKEWLDNDSSKFSCFFFLHIFNGTVSQDIAEFDSDTLRHEPSLRADLAAHNSGDIRRSNAVMRHISGWLCLICPGRLSSPAEGRFLVSYNALAHPYFILRCKSPHLLNHFILMPICHYKMFLFFLFFTRVGFCCAIQYTCFCSAIKYCLLKWFKSFLIPNA